MSEKLEKEVLKEVLTPAMVKEIWTTNYTEALAFTLQDFSVGALLPAVFYMFRRGHRRGQGNFAEQFKPFPHEKEFANSNAKKAGTVSSIARILAEDEAQFAEFKSPLAKDVLADFLLTHCLENRRHEPGRKKPVIRAFPTHYQSAWMDLPASVGDLRLVPESLVAILADQKEGDTVTSSSTKKSFFRVNDDFTQNILLSVFGSGMSARELKSDLVDEFDESVEMGLDQLATIRVARKCKQPIKLKETRSVKAGGHGRGSSAIANQHPIAKQGTRVFRDDTRLFLQAYGVSIPRQSLTQMLESCIGLGLTNIFLSTASSLFHWEQHGELPQSESPWPLVVDCSGGSDHELRRLSEESTDDATRRLHRLPVVLMALRILEYQSRYEIDDLPPKRPDATQRINMLGDVLMERHKDSKMILRDVKKHCMKLSEQFKQEEIGEAYVSILDDDSAMQNPVMRLAETVTQMMGDNHQIRHILACLGSCLMTGASNGLATERRVVFQAMRNGRKSGMMKSMLLTDTMLDFLVHRHLRKPGKGGNTKSNPISFNDFVALLRERYGLLVDQAPPGQTISRELLQRNRRFLERRLRSLGLLMGVNDAESMKRLRPRFDARDEVQGE
ncbi:hypothetical protein Poly24_25350 [Rosistilla carotiformis]|uniref:Uncharacterized protein n=1 Tax=Rosistilla carotiformis TaxID=2528017 RepID=A0A518JTE7_9BACT|nr:hypothetical protein [Rosistilla carotiformis]QDV68822.1 hypothetical protein Poly24_25350 [Rosistilla carotiformis]